MLTVERLESRDCPATLPGFPDFGGVDIDFASADIDNSGLPDRIFVAGSGGSARVRIESGGAIGDRFDSPEIGRVIFDSILFDPAFRGGARATGLAVAGGADLISVTPGKGGGPLVAILGLLPDGTVGLVRQSFAPYPTEFRGGLDVTAGDVDGDRNDELLLLPGEGGGPVLKALTPDGDVLAAFYIAPADARNTGTSWRFADVGGVLFVDGNPRRGVAVEYPDLDTDPTDAFVPTNVFELDGFGLRA